MLETERLQIIPCDDTLFEAIKMGNNVLGRVMGVNVPKKWTSFRDVFAPSYHRWIAHPELRDWWTHLIVLKKEKMLIGVCGYKGEPNELGEVEIGYEIGLSKYRQQGLGTEAAKALVDNALCHGDVRMVLAHTLAEESYSSRILEKLGFKRASEIDDPEEGLIVRWELKK